jgi:pyruvate kinase
MKKTKIICTMGPNTDNRELMKALALNGMDIARFNFSHGSYEEQGGRLAQLKSFVKNWIFRSQPCLIPKDLRFVPAY